MVLDKMTYAANEQNIGHWLSEGRVTLQIGDVVGFDLCCQMTQQVDAVIHAVAESHVDTSFGNALAFTNSNAYGTYSLL
jgi:dTDP-D-glucose 4,6-dehydratase